MDIVICGISRASLTSTHEALSRVPAIASLSVESSPRRALRAFQSNPSAVAIFPEDSLEFGRNLMRTIDPSIGNSLHRALAAETSSAISEVRAIQYGLDGVISIDVATPEMASDLAAISARRWTPRHIDMELMMRDRGLLNRPLLLRDERDSVTTELVALGLTDEEISDITHEDMQALRNRIAELMRLNELTHRTQLAILQISHWPSPISDDE